MDSDDERLTIAEAYRAMFLFLEAYWRSGGKRSDEIGGMLGSMAFLQGDGGTMDPACWSDWEAAVAEMRRSSEDRFKSGL